MNNSHQEQNERVLDQFTQQAESYAKLTGISRGGTPSPFLDAIIPLETDRALDVACGVGRLTLMLARLARHVTGIDLTAAMIDQGRTLAIEQGITNVEWRVGDVLPLPFPDGVFSLVVSQAAFHHLANPAGVLAEMVRVCSHSGRIAINDLSPEPEKSKAFNNVEKLRDPSHVRALPPEELRSLARGMGLVEMAVCTYPVSRISLEAVLATSFPAAGALQKVRDLYRDDAQTGLDRLGLKAQFAADQITIQYPMTFIVWQRSSAEASELAP
jgi:ubiquinone/menaquinone biosynthesis C-methylase UbiE